MHPLDVNSSLIVMYVKRCTGHNDLMRPRLPDCWLAATEARLITPVARKNLQV